MLTVRDLLSWVAFIDSTERNLGPEYAFLHGAFLVLLDGLSLGNSCSVTCLLETLQFFNDVLWAIYAYAWEPRINIKYLTSSLFNYIFTLLIFPVYIYKYNPSSWTNSVEMPNKELSLMEY